MRLNRTAIRLTPTGVKPMISMKQVSRAIAREARMAPLDVEVAIVSFLRMMKLQILEGKGCVFPNILNLTIEEKPVNIRFDKEKKKMVSDIHMARVMRIRRKGDMYNHYIRSRKQILAGEAPHANPQASQLYLTKDQLESQQAGNDYSGYEK